jgi:hypothetical protein
VPAHFRVLRLRRSRILSPPPYRKKARLHQKGSGLQSFDKAATSRAKSGCMRPDELAYRETRRALAEVGFIAAHLTDVSPLAPVRFIANARILLRAGVRCSSITDTHCDDDQDYR